MATLSEQPPNKIHISPETSSSFCKEQTLFDRIDYFKCLIMFELNEQTSLPVFFNEILVKQKLNSSEKIASRMQHAYVLHGSRRLLIVGKMDELSELESDIFEVLKVDYPNIKKVNIPFLNSSLSYHSISDAVVMPAQKLNFQPLILVSEVNETQLKLLADDKSDAIKAIEANTGLKLKKIKKTLYFSGLLFQFVILNEMFAEKISKKSNPLDINCSNGSSGVSSFNNSSGSNEEKTTTDAQVVAEKLDWQSCYANSTVSGNFKLKPKQIDDETIDFAYDVYIFEADLTDLNIDGLVNPTNPDLHPGYTGDGISRRIREKAGKQMHDACKKLLRQESRSNGLTDSEVVVTKASGKLKGKYVLHAIAPTWSRYVLSALTPSYTSPASPSSSLSSAASSYSSSSLLSSSSSSVLSSERLEVLLEQTFTNVLKQAHEPKLQLSSLGIPISATSLGGAFDIPLELCAHSLFTQLVDFKLSAAQQNLNMKIICITSLEKNTVKTLCDIFSNYSECYSKSSWALPLSPMSKLLTAALEEAKLLNPISQQQLVVERSVQSKSLTPSPSSTLIQTTNETSEALSNSNNNLKGMNEDVLLLKKDLSKEDLGTSGSQSSLISKQQQQVTNGKNSKFKSISVTINTRNEKYSEPGKNSPERIIVLHESKQNGSGEGSLISISKQEEQHQRYFGNQKSRTVSNSSNYANENTAAHFNGSGSSKSANTHFKNLENRLHHMSCLFCQRENEAQLITCGNDKCGGVFCLGCIRKYLGKQKSQKCPSCIHLIDKKTLNDVFSDRSSSPSPPPALHSQHIQSKQQVNNHFNPKRLNSLSSSIPNYAVTEAKVFIRKLEEPCDGYENFKTLLITFEIDDGIQSDNHPKPGHVYKGVLKKAYLPEIPEHREILAFYEKALKSGRMFRIAFNRNFEDYRVHLNSEVLLKTSLHGGGRFGYPDQNYVRDLLQMARGSR